MITREVKNINTDCVNNKNKNKSNDHNSDNL